MIKAETISHEATPAPNWLDKCRSVITPLSATITVLVLLVIAVATVMLSQRHTITKQANETLMSTPVPTGAVKNPLSVSNLQGAGQASGGNVPAGQTSAADNVAANASAGGAAVTNQPTANTNSAVGPAPTNSLSQLQSTTTTNLTSTPSGQQVQNTVTNLTNSVLNNL